MNLSGRIKAGIASTLDAVAKDDRERAAMLAVVYADLTARSLAGEDVAAELRHVRAQADALVATNAVNVGLAIRTEIVSALTKTLLAIAVA